MVSASSDKDALDMSSCRVPFVTAEVKLLGLYAIARANDLREHCWGHLSCYEEFLKTRKLIICLLKIDLIVTPWTMF